MWLPCTKFGRSLNQLLELLSKTLILLQVLNFSENSLSDDASRKPEDANYTVDVLTRCKVLKDSIGKKSIKIVPLRDPGEPVVVSLPISQVKFSFH